MTMTSEEVFNYHPIDWLYVHYRVVAPPVLVIEGASTAWTCEFQALKNNKTYTVCLRQGGASDIRSDDAFDALIDLRPPVKRANDPFDVVFSPLALEVAVNRGAVPITRDLSAWSDTTTLSGAVSPDERNLGKPSKDAEKIIKSTTLLLRIVLDAAVANKQQEVSVLCVCDKGRERSVLFLVAWMTIADIMGQHAAPLTDIVLAKIKGDYMERRDARLTPAIKGLMARPKNKPSPIFVNLCENFPYFYILQGIVAQGNKRTIDLTTTDANFPSLSALALNPHYVCAHCAEPHHNTETRQMIFDPRNCHVFCSQRCGRAFRKR